jgi:hypothetical protein
MLVSSMAYSSALKKEATYSYKKLIDFHQIILHYIPEDRAFHNHCCENLKSYEVIPVLDLLNNAFSC